MQIACLWGTIAPDIQAKVTGDKLKDLVGMFERGSLDRELLQQIKLRDEDFVLDNLTFMQSIEAAMEEQGSKVSEVTGGEFKLLQLRLQAETSQWKQHIASIREWEAKTHEAKLQVNETAHNIRAAAIERHCATSYPVVVCEKETQAGPTEGRAGGMLLVSATFTMALLSCCCKRFASTLCSQARRLRQVEAEVGAMVQTMADETMKPRETLYKIFVANLTYLGSNHGSCTHQLARIMADQVNADPDRSAGVVILPNTGTLGAGMASSVITAAQRATVAIFEDGAWKLDVREVSILWDESSMYSHQRPLSHPAIMFFSDASTDAGVRRCRFRDCSLYVRRVLLPGGAAGRAGGVPVLQRAAFINPCRRLGFGDIARLSDEAELKQHISGVGLWDAVPATQALLPNPGA